MGEKYEEKSIGALVHDLNNALAPATLLTDLLLATEMSDEKRIEYLKRIQKSIERGKAIICRIEERIAAGN